MFNVIRADGIFEGVKHIIATVETEAMAQALADKDMAMDKYGNYYHYYEPAESNEG